MKKYIFLFGLVLSLCFAIEVKDDSATKNTITIVDIDDDESLTAINLLEKSKNVIVFEGINEEILIFQKILKR